MKKERILFVLIYSIIIISNLSAQTVSPDSWTQYCGWHYGGQIPKWGGWVREYAKDQFGRFIIDTTTNQLDTIKLNNAYQLLSTLDTTIDILQLDGGLGSARDTADVVEWMKMIEADSGKFWKSIVYQQTIKLTELPNGQKRVYWQIGNEISSPAYSRTIRYWQNGSDINGYNYDKFVIPYYVENYLAPTVEAIDSASQTVFNEKGKINICLGSITNAHNNNAQQFLDSLLNYRIVGVNSPTLSGKYVYELIHIITVHYAMGTANTADWLDNINWYKSWTGTGKIRGVWSTEEVGIKAATDNKGGFASSIATSRYLEWSINNQYEARNARTNYYAWNTGNSNTSVKTFNDTLFSMIGNVKLSNVPNSAVSFSESNLEYHSFLSENKDKGIVIAFPERSQTQNQVTIQEVFLNHSNWGEIKYAMVYSYGTNGSIPIAATVNHIGDSTIIQFTNSKTLDYYNGLLIYIEISDITDIRDGVEEIPSQITLYQNYPNPFNPTTVISYQLPEAGYVTLKVFDLLGREVVTLIDEYKQAGSYASQLSTNDLQLSSGVYFYTLRIMDFSPDKSGSEYKETKKMMLLK
ncbi:MAG: T9SS type A sorting domain-containing protein [Bacteroidetes bacterium]|nr:T9SS type A sorting domain-containing protein [Bacteroidota bacterium]